MKYFIVAISFAVLAFSNQVFAESEEKQAEEGPLASVAFIEENNSTENGRQTRVFGSNLFLDSFLLNALNQNNLVGPLNTAGFTLRPLPLNLVNSFVNLIGGGGFGGLGGGFGPGFGAGLPGGGFGFGGLPGPIIG